MFVAEYMTKEAMYEKYPYKWLLISNPEIRECDGDIVAGELVGVFDNREVAGWEAVTRKIKSRAVINSIQEEI